MKRQALAGQVNYAALRAYTPFIAEWSGEKTDHEVVLRPGGGIAYADEIGFDRDARGVLWARSASRPGTGDPQFGRVHPLRQRKAMRRLLCNVCGQGADHSAEGTLWLLPDYRDDWPDWPTGLAVTEPPICEPCARRSVALCPALRAAGTVVVRVQRAPLAGVCGLYYRVNARLGVPEAADDVTVAYDDRRLPWVLAYYQVRSLEECTVVRVGPALG